MGVRRFQNGSGRVLALSRERHRSSAHCGLRNERVRWEPVGRTVSHQNDLCGDNMATLTTGQFVEPVESTFLPGDKDPSDDPAT